MNGAESLLETLANGGLEVCFANPGTSEMHLVSAIDRSPRVRSILALFEGVATGAADGYGRMTGKPAATLLHLGPGLGNGLANLHNAKRARSPVINIVGDHASYHRKFDAPLTSDVVGVARPMSDWVGVSDSASDLPARGAAALSAALRPPGQVATLVVPADHAWNEAAGTATPIPPQCAEHVPDEFVAAAARALRAHDRVALILGGPALRESGTRAAAQIREATGADLLRETFTARVERGAGRVAIDALPYFGEAAAARLEKYQAIVLVGAPAPVSFFGYPGKPSWLAPEGCEIVTLAESRQDVAAALEGLLAELGCGPELQRMEDAELPPLAPGALDPQKLAAVVARALPEGAIVSDESATGGAFLPAATAGSPPHDWLMLTGGSIGQGISLSVGAAVACPDRKVLCLHGDGGAMYTLQALWTQAREGLDVTTVILANRSYAILNIELKRVGAGTPGPKALDMLDLSRPDLDWVKLAEGMGVPGSRATTSEDLDAQLRTALSEPGPRLIEAVL